MPYPPKLICSFLMLALLVACNNNSKNANEPETPKEIERPTISFTFDDGSTNDILDYKFEDWNASILNTLKEADLKVIFFISGFNKLDEKGQYLLSEWDKENHKIANHTFSHPNFNDKNNTLDVFQNELTQTDSIIRNYKNYVKLFRFPYLKEGKTKEKIDGIRAILKKENYRNGHVTVDASDWYVNSRLIKKMRSDEVVDTAAFETFYHQHLLERATFYDSLAYNLTGRHIKHTLLLHHNLTSALFLKSLIDKFKSEGWAVIDAIDAYKDPIYKRQPNVVPAGESLIWSLAKESGQFEEILRYPAEDSRYEEARMDRLGL